MTSPYMTGTVIPSAPADYVQTPGEGIALFADSTTGVLGAKNAAGTVTSMPWTSKVGVATVTGLVPTATPVTIYQIGTTKSYAIMFRVSVMYASAAGPAIFEQTFGCTHIPGAAVVWEGRGAAAPIEGVSVYLADDGTTSSPVISLHMVGDSTAGAFAYVVDFAALTI